MYGEEGGGGGISRGGAVAACGGMTLIYVGVLYSPSFILRMPPPSSYHRFLLRRFVCAAVSSLLCLLLSSFLLLPMERWRIKEVVAAYGIRSQHLGRAVGIPFALTTLMYTGSLLYKLILFLPSSSSFTLTSLSNLLLSTASDLSAWRTLVVAPITEELVFRACMIPLLLCGGFKPQTIVFLCPVFFSLAHLNHLLDFYSRKNCSVVKTSLAVGTQLAYTMVFGSYASFIFIRTGHLIAPLVAHTVCNFMGLPVVYSKRQGVVVCLGFLTGTVSFLWLLAPLTVPALYNLKTDNCRCWEGYCNWS